MEDLFLGLLFAVVELIFEILLQAIFEALTAFVIRLLDKTFSPSSPSSPMLAFIGYLTLGLAAGAASLLIFPRSIFHTSQFHGVSLIVSPVATGLVMSQIGVFLRMRGKRAVRIESFAYGFAFALGMALVRLVLTR
jgi:hypothetical protein